MKKRVETYIYELTHKKVEDHHFSPVLFDRLKSAFEMGFGIKEAIELHDRGEDDAKVTLALFRSPWKTYKIQIHNLGKDWFHKYYALHGNFAWLQLEHFMISHCWHFKTDETRITNRKIAESIGWLDPNETDPRTIDLAERKVINNLIKLRDERKTVSIEPRHNHGKMGSYHVIRMNWEIIIPLYQMMDPDQPMSIRTRKGIRYRAISLILKVIESFSRGFKNLLERQRKKYLHDVVAFDLEAFKDSKDIWNHFIESVFGEPIGALMAGRFIIPDYTYPTMTVTLHIKGEEKKFERFHLIDRFKAMYHRDLVIVQNFTM